MTPTLRTVLRDMNRHRPALDGNVKLHTVVEIGLDGHRLAHCDPDTGQPLYRGHWGTESDMVAELRGFFED